MGIALESWSSWISVDSNDFRRTPSRTETTFKSRRGPLQLWDLWDRCKTEIREARIP
jgi:hypothetical protein